MPKQIPSLDRLVEIITPEKGREHLGLPFGEQEEIKEALPRLIRIARAAAGLAAEAEREGFSSSAEERVVNEVKMAKKEGLYAKRKQCDTP